METFHNWPVMRGFGVIKLQKVLKKIVELPVIWDA